MGASLVVASTRGGDRERDAAHGRMKQPRLMGACAWLALLAVVTLRPDPSELGGGSSTVCLLCGDRATADAILNVALFLPLGFLLAGRPGALPRAAVAGFGLSLAIELAQIFIPGRYAAVGDVLWNGLGAVAGVGLHYVVGVRLRTDGGKGGQAGRVAALGLGAALLAAGWLLEPRQASPYWGHWTPTFGGMDRYGGTLLQARLDGRAMPRGRFTPDGVQAGAFEGDWSLEVLVESGPPPPRLAPIVSISDERQEDLVLLGADGVDLVWRERLRAAEWRFARPEWRAARVLAPLQVGDTVLIAVRRVGSDYCVAVGRAERCGYAFTTGRTWSLLASSWGVGESRRRLIDVGWLFALFIPVGFLSPNRKALTGNVLIAAGSTLIAVVLTDLTFGPGMEVGAALAGLFFGRAAARMAGGDRDARAPIG